MAFKPGNQHGKKSKRGPSKTSKEVKALLREIGDNIIPSISIDELSNSEKIKLLQIILQYTCSKPLSEASREEFEDGIDIKVVTVTAREEIERLDELKDLEARLEQNYGYNSD
jgi:hypothetical protein